MSHDRPTRDSMSLEEATVSNMWESAAIVEVLERRVLCTKRDLYDIITEFRRKNPRASIPDGSLAFTNSIWWDVRLRLSIVGR